MRKSQEDRFSRISEIIGLIWTSRPVFPIIRASSPSRRLPLDDSSRKCIHSPSCRSYAAVFTGHYNFVDDWDLRYTVTTCALFAAPFFAAKNRRWSPWWWFVSTFSLPILANVSGHMKLVAQSNRILVLESKSWSLGTSRRLSRRIQSPDLCSGYHPRAKNFKCMVLKRSVCSLIRNISYRFIHKATTRIIHFTYQPSLLTSSHVIYTLRTVYSVNCAQCIVTTCLHGCQVIVQAV